MSSGAGQLASGGWRRSSMHPVGAQHARCDAPAGGEARVAWHCRAARCTRGLCCLTAATRWPRWPVRLEGVSCMDELAIVEAVLGRVAMGWRRCGRGGGGGWRVSNVPGPGGKVTVELIATALSEAPRSRMHAKTAQPVQLYFSGLEMQCSCLGPQHW